MEKENVFKDINYKNKAEPILKPTKINDIDTNNYIYDNIIDAQERGTLNISEINSFTSISKSRDQVYSLLDMMGEDPIISSALEIYASDATEPNEEGRVMWVSSNDENISGAVNQILDYFNVDKNAYSQVYSLCKYGDIYLKLYRDSEFNYEDNKERIKNDIKRINESYKEGVISDDDMKKLQEDLILKMYSKNDRYAEYAEQIKNPAEVFDLVKFGKTCGYIKTNIVTQQNQIANNDIIPQTSLTNTFRYNLNDSNIDIYGATEFVHGCLEDNSDRVNEEVSLFTDDKFINNYRGIELYDYFTRDSIYRNKFYTKDNDEYNSEYDSDVNSSTKADSNSSGGLSINFSVKRGKSILYDSFKVWRELSLLENAVLLNRLTKSSILRTINVEVGDMGKTEVQTLLRRIKILVEQKSAYNLGNSFKDYVNPGPAENILYFPTHDGKGAVSTAQIGGDVEVGDLNDLNYWKKKVFASLSIPGQYLGDTDDATGFNGGTSLSLISSRYAKTIKRIQNAYIQMYTDAVNLVLLDKGLSHYINKFSLHMQYPATQEEKDRKENLVNSINIVRETMGLLDEIEDKQTRLEILKSLLSNVISNQEVIGLIQEEIDKLAVTDEDELVTDGSFDDNNDFDTDFGDDLNDVGFDDQVNSEPLDVEVPEESFYNNANGEILNEENDLPNWNELGISYNDAN